MEKNNIKKARILKNEALTPEIYQMVLDAGETAEAVPGQFVNLYCKDGARLLPRAISICEVDEKAGTFRLVYKVLGKGTEEFAQLKENEEIDYLGPLGNGFTLNTKRSPNKEETLDTEETMNKEETLDTERTLDNAKTTNAFRAAAPLEQKRPEEKEILIIGGGVGVPPLLELSKRLNGKKRVLLGFEKESILTGDFKKVAAEVTVATTSGTEGIKGTVMNLLEQKEYLPDQIYSCGPKGMLKAVQAWAGERNIPTELSIEERMACGIGACLVCTCKISEGPDKEDWNYQRVCKDGPVFSGEEVVFE